MEKNSYQKTKEEYYICPKAVKRKLDEARRLRRVVYMYGATGYGKTALIQHYLKNEEYSYFDGATVTEEELELPQQNTKGHRIVVVDNIQFAEPDEVREQIRRLAVRKDVWLILSGRCQCPAWLLSVSLKQRPFVVLGQEDFRLTRDETGNYLEQWGIQPDEEELDAICRDIRGHGMCLKILASVMVQEKSAYDPDILDKMQLIFWNYTDAEIYDQWEPELVEFYMRICIVDSFDMQLAEGVTGKQDVERIIKRSMEIGNFLSVQDGVYTVEPAMLLGMRRRLRQQYPKESRDKLYYKAGCCYIRKGQTLKALAMFEACGDKQQIGEILVENARTNPGAGYLYEMKDYYLALPEDIIRNSMELMAGMSMLSSLLLNIEESERWYAILKETASGLSGSRRIMARSWLAYLDISLPHRGSGDLIRLLKSSADLVRGRKLLLPELSVTSNAPSMMNGGKDFCEWSKKDKELADGIGKIVSFVLGRYGAGLVELALAESFLEKGGDSYEIIRLITKGQMLAKSRGKFEQCFVATGLLMWVHILNGHADDAEMLLQEFKEQAQREDAKKLYSNIENLFCRIALYGGEKAKLAEWMKTAPEDMGDFNPFDRYQYLTKVRVYLLYGKYELAHGLLEKLLYYAELMDRVYVRMETKLLMAILQYRMGSKDWKQAFLEAYREIEEYHFVRLISREAGAVLPLLQKIATEAGGTAFYKQVCKETEKMAEYYPSYLKEHSGGNDKFPENAIRILRLQAEGFSYEEIADALNISVGTVNYHCKQNYKKLGVSGKASAVMEARKRKLI